jgi:glycerate 2-kinase
VTTRVLLAPDKWAGTLTASQAARALADGWASGSPGTETVELPLSDGGPGFVDVLHGALGGDLLAIVVAGPLGDPTPATVLVVGGGDGRTAYVEAAQACGLHLLPEGARAPLDATTTGVAAMLSAAADAGAERIVVGVGGTASTDGGRGLVEALGGVASWPVGIALVAATDVDSPLLGPYGAARTFGPQKGAGPAEVEELERRLTSWVAETGGDPSAEGSGAGGGLAYGLRLLGGRRASGVQTVVDAVGLVDRALGVDLLVTGEGRLDATSLLGKVPRGVAWAAQRAARPCVVVAGDSVVGRREFSAAGIDAVYTLVETYGRKAALERPAELLTALAARVARAWTPPYS